MSNNKVVILDDNFQPYDDSNPLPILITNIDDITGGGVTVHGALTGLSDDDHTQYSLVTGSRSFTGQVTINDSTGNCLVLNQTGGTSNNFFSFQTSGAEVAFMDGLRMGMPRGTAANPSYTFMVGAAYDTDTGMWSPGANTIAFSTTGVERFRILADGTLAFYGNLTTTGLIDGVDVAALETNAVTKGNVLLMKDDGTITSYKASADTNAARGTILKTAITASSSGDTLIVGAGTYDANSLLKSGVNYYFVNGAIVHYTGATTGALFEDLGADMTISIDGFGEFIHEGTGVNKQAFNFTGNTSGVVRCKSIDSKASVAIRMAGSGTSSLTFYADTIKSFDGVFDNVSSACTLEVFARYVYHYGSGSFCVEMDGGRTIVHNAFLESTGSSVVEVASAGVAELHNCRLKSSTDVAVNNGLSASNLFLINCEIDSPTASDIDGAAYVSGCYTPDGTALNASGVTYLDKIVVSQIIASGTASSTTFLRGDSTWAAPSFSNDEYASLTSGVSVPEGYFCYLKDSDGLVYIADASASSTSSGLILWAPMDADEEEISWLVRGLITTSGLTPGAVYYLSETAGQITSTPPAIARIVGFALSSTVLYFNPDDNNEPETPNSTHVSSVPVINPNAAVTFTSVFPLFRANAALTVTRVTAQTSSSSYEIAGDVKWADNLTALTGATVINDFDTTSGARDDTSITAGSVAAGKWLYVSFDSAPNAALESCVINIEWGYD